MNTLFSAFCNRELSYRCPMAVIKRDMSDIFFSCIWHHLNNKSYDLAETIHHLQEYEKEQGFLDGKPDINGL